MSEERKTFDLTRGHLNIIVVVTLLVAVAGGSAAVTSFFLGQENITSKMSVMNDDLGEVKTKQEKISIDQALMRDDIEDLAQAVEVLAAKKVLSDAGPSVEKTNR